MPPVDQSAVATRILHVKISLEMLLKMSEEMLSKKFLEENLMLLNPS
jgi:hypothetical protein